MAKKFTWLQIGLKFFRKKKQKKLRIMPNGAEKQLIYLKILALSLEEEGYLIYEGVEETIEEEIALEIEEDEEEIKEVLEFLLKNRLMEEKVKEDDYAEYFLKEVPELLGGECESARRVRDFRKRRKEKLENKQALQCNGDVTESNGSVTKSNESKSKSKEIEKELELESRGREILENDYHSIKELLLGDYSLNTKDIKKVMELVEAKELSLAYVKEKIEVTEYCTKGTIKKNMGYLYQALREDYASVAKRKEWEGNKKVIAPTKFHNYTESSRRDYTDDELNSYISNVKIKRKA